jgi:hypothetical protein
MELLAVLFLASLVGKLSGQQLATILIAAFVWESSQDPFISAVGAGLVAWAVQLVSSFFVDK